MDLIQLKVPPDRARIMADAIEQHLDSGETEGYEAELTEILAWLRYRITRWDARHPHTPVA